MGTWYPSLAASRILSDADRSSLSSTDNGDVTALAKGNFILATVIGYDGEDTAASAYKLQWRDVTDSGSFADVASTGEIKWAASSSVLADGNAVTSSERKCTAVATGQTWQDGVESLGDNAIPSSGTLDLGSDCFTELHWGLSCADAQDGHQYEFLLYNVTASASTGTCLAQITTKILAQAGVKPILGPWFSGGFSVPVTDTRVTAKVSALTLSALASDVDIDVNVSCGYDALAMTVNNSTVDHNVPSVPGFASVIWMRLIGGMGGVSGAVTVNATCDALSLTENNVSINAEKNVSCTVDSLTTQTYPANINSKTRVTASVDSLVIAEYTASINKAVNVSCSLDTMTLTSKAASVGILYNANASLVELIITTYGVSIDSGMAVAEVSSATSITPANLMVDKTSGYASILGMWMGGIGTRYSSDGWSTLLSVNDIASESTVEEVTTTQEHILDVGALGSETGTESITVIRSDTLSVADIESATSVETIVALVDKILAIEDMSSQATVDSIKLQYMNSLAIAMGANNLLDGGEAERCLRRM